MIYRGWRRPLTNSYWRKKMIFNNFKGNHYDSGLKYGKQLYTLGINPLEQITINNKQVEYMKQVLPIYQEWYPNIIDEIQGICDGLQINSEKMLSFLFTMYIFIFDAKCSTIATSNSNGTYLGKNSDFNPLIKEQCTSNHYKLDDFYSFKGQSTAWTEIEDGLNSEGLAVALTFVYPTKIGLGFNSGMLVRFMLENFKTVNECIDFLKNVPIASAQNITLADKEGNICIVESNCDAIEIIYPDRQNQSVISTNHFNSDKLLPYQGDLNLDPSMSTERFNTLINYSDKNNITKQDIESLLSGSKGFLCHNGECLGIETVWSSIYDCENSCFYLCEGNPIHDKYKKHLI